MRISPNTARNWVADALKAETDKCLIWPYAKQKNGYGSFCPPDWPVKMARVHRYICIMTHGQPPTPKHEAAHSCGNRSCANHRHIRWATPKENHADQIAHGTINRGARHGFVKLTEVDVLGIRTIDGHTSELARYFGVSPATIRDARSGKTWAWL